MVTLYAIGMVFVFAWGDKVKDGVGTRLSVARADEAAEEIDDDDDDDDREEAEEEDDGAKEEEEEVDDEEMIRPLASTKVPLLWAQHPGSSSQQ